MKKILLFILLIFGILIPYRHFNQINPDLVTSFKTQEMTPHGTAYFQAGQKGTDIVFIHGVWGFKFTFEPLIPFLAKDFRLWAFDLYGYGYSIPSGPMTWEGHVEQLKTFLDDVKLKEVIVVGYSMGGAIAQAFAAHYPERVKQLVLVNALGFHSTNPEATQLDIQMNLNPGGDRLIRLARWCLMKSEVARWITQKMTGRLLVKTILRMVYHDPIKISERIISEYTFPLKMPQMRDSVSHILSLDSPTWFYETQKKIETLTLPIHIIWGHHDRWIPLPRAFALRSLFHLPPHHVRIINTAGHNPIEETPETVATLIKEIL